MSTEDISMYLRVEAFTTSLTGRSQESASLTESDYPVLAVPGSSQRRRPSSRMKTATVTREVSEGTPKGMNVGAPVRATDDITNALTYTLVHRWRRPNDKFEIDQKTGQIKTMVDLDSRRGPRQLRNEAG